MSQRAKINISLRRRFGAWTIRDFSCFTVILLGTLDTFQCWTVDLFFHLFSHSTFHIFPFQIGFLIAFWNTLGRLKHFVISMVSCHSRTFSILFVYILWSQKERFLDEQWLIIRARMEIAKLKKRKGDFLVSPKTFRTNQIVSRRWFVISQIFSSSTNSSHPETELDSIKTVNNEFSTIFFFFD